MPIDGYTMLEPFLYAGRVMQFAWWLIVPLFLFVMMQRFWSSYFGDKYTESLVWKHLMISLPRDNERGAKAMEQFFASLWSIWAGDPYLPDEIFEGEYRDYFSVEIVSIEGNVRFIIRTLDQYQRQVETQIYAQFPDAEINEVEDYTNLVPRDFLDQDYDLWGTAFQFSGKKEYPIRSYKEFEEVGDVQNADSIAGLLEYMGRIKKGQQAWYQVMLRPLNPNHDDDPQGRKWLKESEEVIKTITEKYNWDPEEGSGGGMMPPNDQDAVKAISERISKLVFEVKIRYAHIAKEEAFEKPWAAHAFVSAMQQFNYTHNGLKPNGQTVTSVRYLLKNIRVKGRKRLIMNAMRTRDWLFGNKPLVLNIEELATIYHFPQQILVPTEKVEKITSKKGAAPKELSVLPTDLPTE